MSVPANQLPSAYLLKDLQADNFEIRHLQAYVDSLVDQYAIPGLSLTVWHNGKSFHAAIGILDVDTGVTTTPDSLFQIGSITKVVTATLIMQLIDASFVDRCYLLPQVPFGPKTLFNSNFGLAAYAVTENLGRAQRLAQGLNAGMVTVVGSATPSGGGIELGVERT